jgi:hypothetical protein
MTTGAGFALTETDGAVYAMTYEIRKALPAKVYCVALFESPEAPKTPLRRECELPADAKQIQIHSPRISAIRNNTRYKVKLTLYLDSEHTSVFTQHDQEVLFNMKKELHGFLQQRYGLVVR